MNNLSRPNHYELFNVQPVAKNIPEQTNSYEAETSNNSKGLQLLLTITSVVGIVYTIYTVKQHNKLLESSIKQRLKSASTV